jgi:hypothetical protein
MSCAMAPPVDVEVFEFAGVVILLSQSRKEFEGNTVLFAGECNKEARAQLVLGT